ncbi:MAG: VRR-NUC domain-containing protein [candidate division Zixibacteria bacterium]|nr:VRR-NUC domain-containing protein [candidate division Zixibacteria bacterium]
MKNNKDQKIPRNQWEKECYLRLIEDNWNVTKKGWPDFACFRGEQFIVIEVKPKRSHNLKKDQEHLLETLSRRGIKCYKWTPDGGFESLGWKQQKLEHLGAYSEEYKRGYQDALKDIEVNFERNL